MKPADQTIAAVCHRCGGNKRGPLVPCKTCGFTPTGEERPVAWLFSGHHLDSDELADAAQRVRAGDRPDTSRELRAQARSAMGAAPLTDAARTPFGAGWLLLLGIANLMLTPLVGYAVWFGLREERPRAARQALALTLPISAVLGVAWVVLVASQRL
ncbi:MAG: hypothetical protein VX000_03880 [Myxococcota bacterium]|nr:hypothetical protein [Myxococcota bacterium]